MKPINNASEWVKIELPIVRSNRALRGVITKQRKQIEAMKNCGNCADFKNMGCWADSDEVLCKNWRLRK